MHIVSVIPEMFQEFEDNISLGLACFECNYKCFFCHMQGIIYDPQQIINDAKTLFYKHINPMHTALVISGGEPTLWEKSLKELLQIAKARNLKTKIFSNASNPEVIHSLCKEGLVDAFSFDLKGFKNLSKILQIPIQDAIYLQSLRNSILYCKQFNVSCEIRITKHSLLDVQDTEKRVPLYFPGIPAIWQDCIQYGN